MQPYSPVPGSRDFVILKVQEFIRRHIVWHDIVPVSLHHYREYEAMEYDIVLSDEVYQSCVLILPPLLPGAPFLWLLLAEFLGV